ncbi:hypothetical protein KCU92_g288, partial [Aureobasidium melanogenum]
MSHLARAVVAAGLTATASASSLADVCTVSNVQAALPANGTFLGIDLIPSAVTASAVYNASTSMGGMGGASSGTGTTYSYCNVTITYTHTGKSDEVVVKYAFPQPSDFKKRFYVVSPSPVPQLEVSSTALLVAPLPLDTTLLTTAMTRSPSLAMDPSTGTQLTCSPTRPWVK